MAEFDKNSEMLLRRLRNCATPGHPYGADGARLVFVEAVDRIERLERELAEAVHERDIAKAVSKRAEWYFGNAAPSAASSSIDGWWKSVQEVGCAVSHEDGWTLIATDQLEKIQADLIEASKLAVSHERTLFLSGSGSDIATDLHARLDPIERKRFAEKWAEREAEASKSATRTSEGDKHG